MEIKSCQVSQSGRKLFPRYHDGSVYFLFVNLITVNVDLLAENIYHALVVLVVGFDKYDIFALSIFAETHTI